MEKSKITETDKGEADEERCITTKHRLTLHFPPGEFFDLN
jgi:hypothetical protein